MISPNPMATPIVSDLAKSGHAYLTRTAMESKIRSDLGDMLHEGCLTGSLDKALACISWRGITEASYISPLPD